MQDPAWVIRKPSVGRYTADVLELEDRSLDEPAEGELRVRTLYLSLDPSNLMWLKLLPGWMEDVKVGDVMKGPSIAVVERSRHRDFSPGAIVTGPLQWRRHSNIPASAVSRAHPAAGALRARTHVLNGLEHAAAGLELLLTGANHGKLLVAAAPLVRQNS